jgi:hypothetical protein
MGHFQVSKTTKKTLTYQLVLPIEKGFSLLN